MKREDYLINEIIDKVEKSEITPEEGLERIQKLKTEQIDIDFHSTSDTMYYVPDWQSKPILNGVFPNGRYMIFTTQSEKMDVFLSQSNLDLIRVVPGRRFQSLGNDIYEINPSNQEDYHKLVENLCSSRTLPEYVVHMWSLDCFTQDEQTINNQLNQGAYSLFYLAKALMMQCPQHKVQMKYLYLTDIGQPLYECVGALSKTIHIENPQFVVSTLGFENMSDWAEVVGSEFQAGFNDTEVRYQNGNRFVKKLKERSTLSNYLQSISLKKHGVYLITGGAGGLGLLFAEYLAKHTNARLILSGRSDLNTQKEERLEKLRVLGAQVRYIKADVSQKSDVDRLIQTITSEFEHIDGIIHSAGVIRDTFVVQKSKEDFDNVLAPKIYGTVFLDEATQNMNLDFFVLFSSIAGVMGNIGQCDYAIGNAFLDAYAHFRSQVKGRTLSINWPLWKEGGMNISAEESEILSLNSGLEMLPSDIGLIAWEKLLGSDLAQCVVAYGERNKVEKFLNPVEIKKAEPTDLIQVDAKELKEKTETFIKEIFKELLKLPLEKIDSTVTFQDYGVDSIFISRFNYQLEQSFENLPKTMLFEVHTIQELVDFLMENHKASLICLLELDKEQQSIQKEEGNTSNAAVKVTTPEQRRRSRKRRGSKDNHTKTAANIQNFDEDIAIIGISGRYPNSNNIDEFWENLKLGRDCVSEIPISRWDWRDYFDPNPEKAKEGKMYSKWGGFLEDVDKFDPMFFNILPREAEMIDPQERIFLETCWSALEDAGYTRKQLQESVNKQRISNVGVFAGVTTNSYILNGMDEWHKGSNTLPNSSPWSLANRVSFVMNFNGPSMPVDTACSSSLTAIHMASESLKKGECEVALAGGVNLYLHYSKYITMCQLGMLSSTGRCRSFSAEGDGFVPGEGVGVAVLKPLSRAIADGDHIYGVIKGSGINHGGSTNGYTVPNPNAQSNLITEVLEKSKVGAETISFIEAHGTGTALGDPIEVSGLTKAFRKYTDKKQICSISSSKSNIGHLEAAAGIAGLTKILLQMKHKKLVPSLHCETINPNITFENTPFYIQCNLEEWKQPIVVFNGIETKVPRRAGISSFGAGGANAHVVIEEYVPDALEISNEGTQPQVIVLSARNEDQLREYAKKLGNALRQNGDIILSDMAFTLQVGREEMNVRLALVAENIEEVAKRLLMYSKNQIEKADVFTSTSTQHNTNSLANNEIEQLIERGEWEQLGEQWVKGVKVDWSLLHRGQKRYRIPLPTYPFAKERYWLKRAPSIDILPDTHEASAQVLHSLSDTNKFIFNKKSESINEPPSLMYYSGRWKTDNRIIEKQPFVGNILVFSTEEHVWSEWQKNKIENGLIIVKPAMNYRNTGKGIFEINPSKYEDYVQLFETLQEQGNLPQILIHQWLNSETNPKACLEKGTYSIFNLIQVVSKMKINSLNRFLAIYTTIKEQPNPYVEMIAAYSKSLSFVMPSLVFSTVEISTRSEPSEIRDIVLQELENGAISDIEIRYEGDQRQIRKMELLSIATSKHAYLRNGGIYVITGGLGAIGLVFARHLAREYNANLVLIGRSSLNEQKRKVIRELQALGAEVLYIQGDVTDRDKMEEGITAAKMKFGAVHGLFHAAGFAPDKPINKKNLAEFKENLGPKIQGTVVMDEVTKDESLDLFVLFSSTSSILGDFGQCDYALGNRFLDSYAGYREKMRHNAKRSGRTISINWPLWREGGMHVVAENEELYLKGSRMIYLENESGIEAFNTILSGDSDCVVVMAGQSTSVENLLNPPQELKKKMDIISSQPEKKSISYDSSAVPRTKKPIGSEIEKLLENDLIRIASNVSGIATTKLDTKVNLGDIGFDSITLKELSTALTEQFGFNVSPSVFFANSNLQSLCKYMLNDFLEELQGIYKSQDDLIPENLVETNIDMLVGGHLKERELLAPADSIIREKVNSPHRSSSGSDEKKEVAIIGINGLFPDADNLEEFWQHLVEKKDLVTEVPANRWDWKETFSKQKGRLNKSYSKWGGFIKDVDKFDAQFFNISPREASLMDPQQRLILQAVWKAIEDSGHRVSELSGRAVGLFVGAQFNDYANGLQEITQGYVQKITGNAAPVLSNRISYLLNFRGPSELIDTACSSSLVALHRAVKSIQLGESELAVAGGVSLMLTPQTFIDASAMGMLSVDGKCKTFDSSANGYVKGEGVGALLLKPLDKAIEDGNPIYAIIKGTAENHGGKANSLTAPNSEAQAELLIKAYEEAGFSPKTVSYIETHGTGTELGDPVEIDGLKKAFSELYKRNGIKNELPPHIGLGSVKTNIGHLEPASGIVGVIKVLLSMKHRILPGLVHFNELNPFIELKNTPFYLVTETRPWEHLIGQDGKSIPLRAGISSFGFGGTNAHVVLEEYERLLPSSATVSNHCPQLIVLSAATEDRLRVQIAQLLAFLDRSKQEEDFGELSIENIAFTLQMGRESMNYRFAFVSSSIEELQMKLRQYLEDCTLVHELYVGNVKELQKELESSFAGRTEEEFIRLLIEKREFTQLARLWVQGANLDWENMHKYKSPVRVSLPTYPFAKNRYWVGKQAVMKTTDGEPKLYSLVDSNVSTLEEQCFKKVFSGKEFYLEDHGRILPGVIYLDMVRAAGNMSSKKMQVKKLKNIVFSHPILVENETEVNVSFIPNRNIVDFKVKTDEGDQKRVHVQGQVIYELKDELPLQQEVLNPETIMGRCQGGRSDANQYYNFLDSLGAFIGPRFKGIQEFYYNDHEALSRVDVADELTDTLEQFVLHPVLMDGGFQTCVAFAYQAALSKDKLYLPFVVGEMELINPSLRICYVYVIREENQHNQQSEELKYQILFLDANGHIAVKIRDFSIRAVPNKELIVNNDKSNENMGQLFFQEAWEQSDAQWNTSSNHLKGNILIFDDQEDLFAAVTERKDKKTTRVVLVKPGDGYKKIRDSVYEIDPLSAKDYEKMIEELIKIEHFPDCILHMWSMENGLDKIPSLQMQLERGLYSLFHLSQSWMKNQKGKGCKIVYSYACESAELRPAYAAVSGFAKTLGQEHPNLSLVVMGVQPKVNVSALLKMLAYEMDRISDFETEVLYWNETRHCKRIIEVQEEQMLKRNQAEILYKGVYLITGGAGGLGLIFARYLAKRTQAKIVLTGRSPLNDTIRSKLDDLKRLGAEVMYLKTDISVENEVRKLIQDVKKRFGNINAVFHSAGVNKDSLVIDKSICDMKDVLAPKVFGLSHLYEALKEEPLKLFVLFSSISAVLGNRGQSDYAFANRFMDYNAQLLQNRMPNCKFLSINWPLWRQGGMSVDVQSEEMIFHSFGMQLLDTNEGIKAFEKAMVSSKGQLMVLNGDKTKLRNLVKQEGKDSTLVGVNKLIISEPAQIQDTDERGTEEMDLETDYGSNFQKELVQIISEILDLNPDNLNLHEKMSELGFDSFTFTELANEINRKFELDITPAILFSHSSPESIAETLCKEYSQQIQRRYKTTSVSNTLEHKETESLVQPLPVQSSVGLNSKHKLVEENIPLFHSRIIEGDVITKDLTQSQSVEKKTIMNPEPIAIVGMSGKMPQSQDLKEFWENLINGKDLISEIPSNRWNWQDYFGDSTSEANKTYVKWGGFMPSIDEFDPLFFSISPREAELMDPQERLVIEMTWKAMEDAGLKSADLANTNTGVFIGVTNSDYKELMVQEGIPTAMTHCFIANRVSYLLNLHGPSEVVDTACSSSLVAIHRAVEAIRLGHCDQAFAGGVNVIANPNLFIYESKAGMLSPDGHCKTFDQDANGYVRGEGVGIVMLKSLSKAEADGNPIYAVIRGTATNHGGHGSSLTAPNPKSQADVLQRAYENAGINPSTISYIEAHGTGTSLGDPIEIEGMKIAFKEMHKKWNQPLPIQPYCMVGSVKTNIGHLESAAGIASVFKVVMAMNNRIIPGTIHFNKLNPYIQLRESPFSIVTENTTWRRLYDKQNRPVPRRCGVSSFGIGGVNAHIVLEEYEGKRSDVDEWDNQQHLIVLSAKNEARLKEYAQKMVDYLEMYATELTNDQYCQSDNQLLSFVLQDLLQMASDVMQVEHYMIDPEENLTDYGVDAMKMAEFAERVSTRYHLDFSLAMSGKYYTNLLELGEYLIKTHLNMVRGVYTDQKKETLKFLTHNKIPLGQLAYTLQTGRDAMAERLAFPVSSLVELKNILLDFVAGREEKGVLYRGNVKLNQKKSDIRRKRVDYEVNIQNAIRKKELHSLAELWVSGANPDWRKLYEPNVPVRLPLPSYPFARSKYWFPRTKANSSSITEAGEIKLHPLVGKNTSTLSEQRFTTYMTGKEFYLADHIVNGRKLLPGAAYLEMVWVSGELASESPVSRLLNVMWAQPVEVGEKTLDVHVSLYPDGDFVEYDVYAVGVDQAKVVFSQGKMELQKERVLQKQNEKMNLEAIKRRCLIKREGTEGYEAMRKVGLDLHTSFQSIKKWFISPQEVLTRVELPETLYDDFEKFSLHPTLVDAALQTVAGLMDSSQESGLYLPFGMEELELLHPLETSGYAYAVEVNTDRDTEFRKFDIWLLDDIGRILLKIKGFSTRQMRKTKEVEMVNESISDGEILDILKMMKEGQLDVREVDEILGGLL